MWTFHYGKRILESLFVHSFSHGTMPLFNLFKNCAYYWTFAFAISYSVNKRADPEISFAFPALFAICECLNFYCHYYLASLRSNGDSGHYLPKGFLFNKICCPNYTMEIMAWICFAVFVRTIPAYVFPIVGAAQMWIWAGGKKSRLIKSYPEVVKRGRLLPVRWL
jgi:very-long-chain enoyl-CoA reductase